MKRPQAPCKNCKDRTAHCHNETCPHGWEEYKRQLEAFNALSKGDKEAYHYLSAHLARMRKAKAKHLLKPRKTGGRDA